MRDRKEAQRRYNAKYRAANLGRLREYDRQKFPSKYKAFRSLIDTIKVAKGCVDCGYKKHPAALEFDHVRGEKRFSVGRGAGKSVAVLLAEIAKCEIRCANCHRERTVERRQRSQLDISSVIVA